MVRALKNERPAIKQLALGIQKHEATLGFKQATASNRTMIVLKCYYSYSTCKLAQMNSPN